MQNKKVVIGVIAAVFAVAVVLGYLIGTRSGGVRSGDAPVYSNAAGTSPSVGVTNRSNIIEDLKAGIKSNPNDPDLLLRLADAYFEQKQFAEAVNYYKKVIGIRPNDADVYTEIGLSLHYLGNSQEGLKYLDEGIKKNPYHQRIWLTKGFILAGTGDIASAKKAWEKTKAINSESPIGKAASDYLGQIAVKK
ncbi:MAG: tetratricopeptide repeat protein [Deltaproteobacteria bacterium]|nr:tetratricopeptide repeat protein [Deltaproteobacteria bacterium]